MNTIFLYICLVIFMFFKSLDYMMNEFWIVFEYFSICYLGRYSFLVILLINS
ncbi:Uncharacterised protein [Myroides odoratus]|uniref:Uncharacterized protein n=1 Tax=Myroides odoratus TaxID=256 RepID=A0A378U1F6_MYROD|nr:hypothetical protein [Myroides odoratus]STZ69089.1 Uncharacterised protein [Myroides odoratus]